MEFHVVVTEHVKFGQTIRIVCPDGTAANVKIPKGLRAGDSFILEMPVDQLNNPQKVLDSIREDQSKFTPTNRKGFWDKDITSIQDFALALAVGLIVGMGIVAGFTAGILYATTNVPVPFPPVPTQTLLHPLTDGK